MAAGEFPLGLVYARRVESMKKSGAPIEWVKANRLSGRSEVEPLVQEMNPRQVEACRNRSERRGRVDPIQQRVSRNLFSVSK
jgi:hypothetical protein